MEALKKGKSQSRVKVLSAVTSVSRDELIKVVDNNKQMSERKAAFLQKVERKNQVIAGNDHFLS
ncbi:hypothetical protein [Methanosarcina barkeri]|uniref:hypothetical protein n=1 Tax=Methanosarcina barkeri TaxID=2208 RepID=UPI0006CFE8FC|nr:hypothetical protein [Methanosarcina barkeri]